MLNLKLFSFSKGVINLEWKVDSWNENIPKHFITTFFFNYNLPLKCKLYSLIFIIFIGCQMFPYFKYAFGQQPPNSQVIAKIQVKQMGIFQLFKNANYNDQ